MARDAILRNEDVEVKTPRFIIRINILYYNGVWKAECSSTWAIIVLELQKTDIAVGVVHISAV